ncbi:2-oxo-4-hydroxy-4-carboxy-5-ureidoimidazoline decarboxylase [Kitasatospora purpeofusca]|uniref:2-oxo-4-hydroxy-4-carboxy-5-ureidoimidazoline decarboxylase n=1 Tax=Kitasatospora purpeofusca TaxID=67352 RepID=UPI00225BE156|nr:2-oxo-4-hydroxy-4-carboxy-5-ureidoimidazoline decarboxylase [Kitasatospora purpeofusca]MCX4756718.1 2-oxo-4-hydroxy-4-carboxy-5-ureidoimidazoline decarboxylase [Kitasatospora purpeofusca]WSR35491.1 2-oxo-4-hydroxy-4-carboxy-5-ureidoimidazoline decarboxylase [Kitasatospora purpeofusca]WSR43810.1 2-oxo-4-hydroxy-4-carboxy-5-ureidoimidazoline decarboxylase [Kitasatospora purpeofusca]
MTNHPHALDALAAADAVELREILLDVCTSPNWADAVAAARPWKDRRALLEANAEAMAGLSVPDLHEAMAGHARIGAPKPGDATSEREQAGVHGADEALLDELRRANAAYEAKFGHVFLICATGRTAATMLDALRERLPDDPATEAEIVRGELRKINDIRINRLLDDN